MNFTRSLFIFRRDLRVDDNTALIAACQQSQQVILCFIFDPRQVDNQNSFKSNNALQFMIESLQDLEQQITQRGATLLKFYGLTEIITAQLIEKYSIQAVFVNADYTPFSTQRDGSLSRICEPRVKFLSFDDALLNPPHSITKENKIHYSVFTPYWKKAQTHEVSLAKSLQKLPPLNIAFSSDQSIYHKLCPDKNLSLAIPGGRNFALKILQSIKQFKEYETTHNIPSLATTRLSAHLKFGTVSIRESFQEIRKTLGLEHPIIRQLYWRDFYTQIAYYAPFVFGHPYQKKYEHLKWNNNSHFFTRWCEGNTGFPIVDAGMRELNTTGFMHNRVRMIVASFLTKDLHIDWRWGEQYFAQQLSDYDPAVNNGNWQWCASTGCDPQPYFRIFNPWLQQAKFDPECIYIKHWVPELKAVDNSIIHHWYQPTHTLARYPQPMVDHKLESDLAKKTFAAQRS